jgi:chaperonin GroES
MSKLIPTEDRILVKRLESEEKTPGGIIIPDTAKEKPMYGEVISAGPGKKSENGSLIAMTLKAGDKVLFAKWSGTEVKVGAEEMLIMKESDVLAIVQ